MHIKRLLSLFTGMLLMASAWAQDIHFTQFYMSPMTLNPSLVGKFEGTVRIGGIYRDQWAAVINDQFQTPSAWVDAPIIRGFRRNDWVGVGLMLYSDKVGVGGLTHSAGKFGAAYHFALNKKATTYISLGGHYGGEQRKADGNRYQFQDGLENSPAGGYNPGNSIDNGRIMGNARYNDFDGGISISSKLNKNMDFNLGFSMFHIGEPNYSLLGAATGGGGGGGGGGVAGTSRLPRRSMFHGQFNVALNEKFSLSPQFLYQTMSGADEIVVQAMSGYLINPEKDIKLNFGLGYRLSDALNALVGVTYKNLNVGIAYDINTSDLSSVSNNRGGFEIAANYIIKIYKPAVPKPKVLCPRY
jgi:type IX secretion system PorP/SprF family membrane protein